MLFDLLLLPLLGGYWFISLFKPTQFAFYRQKGERMLFSAATAGLLLGILGIISARILANTSPVLLELKEIWLPWPHAGAALISLLLGPLGAVFLNLFFQTRSTEAKSIQKYGTGLEQIYGTPNINHR